MSRSHRISAGAIVLHQGKVLLVRYRYADGTTFLVAPGGGVRMTETLPRAAAREVAEETGLQVDPYPCRVLFVEEFLSLRYRHIKTWLLCRFVGGELQKTRGAKKEGITEVGWYSKNELAAETVHPSPLVSADWQSFLGESWETRYLNLVELRTASF